MSKLDCEVVKDLLPLYKDKLCSETTVAQIDAHLQDCKDCTAEYAEINEQILTEEKVQIDSKDSFKKFVKKVNRKRLIYVLLGIAITAVICLGGAKVYTALKYDCSVVIPFDQVKVSDIYMTEEGDVMVNLMVDDYIVTGMNYSSTKTNPELTLFKRHFMPEMTREFQRQMNAGYTLNDVWIQWDSKNGDLLYGNSPENVIWTQSDNIEVRKDFTDYKLLPVDGAVTTLFELEQFNKYGSD